MQTDSDLFAPVPIPETSRAGLVLCEFDGLTLALPQSDVTTIEHGGELGAPLAGELVYGWYESATGPWPVYALDAELVPRPDTAKPRAFLVFIKTDAVPIGLLSESVRIIGKREELQFAPLPEPLASCARGVEIARLDQRKIALCFASGAFREWLRRIESAGHDDTVIHPGLRRWSAASTPTPDAPVAVDPSTASVRAWLLEWEQPLALGVNEVIELVDAPVLHKLPFGPPWCRTVLAWRDQFLAVAGSHAAVEGGIVVVTAYQLQDNAPLSFAAFALSGPPRQITVADGLDCEAPVSVFNAAQLRATFKYEERVLVVPELAEIFGKRVA